MGLRLRLEEFKSYIDENLSKKRELVSQMPYKLGEGWDPELFFEYITKNEFITLYYDLVNNLGEKYSELCIKKMNDAYLPQMTLGFIYVPKDLEVNKFLEPAIIPLPNSTTKSIIPFIYCLSGNEVDGEDLMERASELKIEGKNKRILKKVKKMLDSDFIDERIEKILSSFDL